MPESDELRDESAAPVDIEVVVDGKSHRLRYDQAFVLGCELLERGQAGEAARLFERMEAFVDRGPRAFIMQAFCEAAAMHPDKCSQALEAAFEGKDPALAETLQNAFMSYHVGIRGEALQTLVDVVNAHAELPSLSLLLGNMLKSADKLPLAQKCWTMAVERDRTGGAVAAAAERQLRRLAGDAAKSDPAHGG